MTTSPKTATPSPHGSQDVHAAGGPVPKGFSAVSFTAISNREWWVLGTAPCSDAPCTSVVRTTDGGAHWLGLPAPRTPLTTARRDSGISQIRFADRNDGFAFGPQLWTTHNGGSSWRRSFPGGRVTGLAAADGYVYAVVSHGQHQRLLRSPASHDHWRALPAPKSLASALWVQGDHVFAQDSYGKDYVGKHLLYSLDAGEHWHRAALPVPGLPCEFDQVAAPVLWERCNTGMMAHVWVSHNNGRTFHDPAHREGTTEFTNAVVFAAASNTVAVAAFQNLQRTTNGGRTFTTVGPKLGTSAHPFAWSYVGFTDPTHGVAIGASSKQDATGQLWVTRNGGATWHRSHIVGATVTRTSNSSAAFTTRPAACKTSNLTLSVGPLVSEETGEHAVILRLTNTASSCTIRGYPTVRLSRHGHTLTFHDAPGGMYTGHHRPRTVAVDDQHSVFFEVAKYRCDVGRETPATSIEVGLPHRPGKLSLSLHHRQRALLTKCAKGNAAQSYVLEISPVHRHASY